MNYETEKIALQAQILDIQKEASKISLENQNSLKVDHNRTSEIAINDSGDTLKLEKDDSWMIMNPVSKQIYCSSLFWIYQCWKYLLF
jgi:hypothetical protein